MSNYQFSKTLLAKFVGAQRITVLTGAGISKESGVPTFREAQTGLWSQYDPQALATAQAFRRDPALVWNWYSWRRELVGKAEPNRGHKSLVALEKRTTDFTLITQNVDNLHQVAGSGNVIELHGNIAHFKCFDCDRPVNNLTDTTATPPICQSCGGFLRPDVVWFGEALQWPRVEKALEATVSSDIFLSIGTSTLVTPAATLPFEAQRAGVFTIEINPGATPFTPHADEVLAGPAGVILPQLLTAIDSAAA